MVNRLTFLLIFCVIVSGCTIHMKNGETITWPAPAAGNQAASTTSWHYSSPQSSYPNPQQTSPDVVYANSTTPAVESSVAATPSSSNVPIVSELPNQPQQQTPVQPNEPVTAQGGQNGNQRTSRKDPFNSLMTSDQDRMETALDRIAEEYRKVAGNKARLSVGSPNIPNNSDYIRVTRHDLPVLAEPNFGAQNLTILGLAQVGEYLPVLQEIESTYTLNNPLSSTPNNGGKWCQVRVSSGESGWVMVEPVGMGATSFAQIVRRPQPQPVGNGNQDTAAVIGLIIVGGVIVLFVKFTRSGGSGSSSSYSGGGTTYSSDSDSSYDYDSSSGDSGSETTKTDDDEKEDVEPPREVLSEKEVAARAERTQEEYEAGQRDGSQANMAGRAFHHAFGIFVESESYNKGFENGEKNPPKGKWF